MKSILSLEGLLIGFFLLSAGKAGGEEWKFICQDDEGSWFYDAETAKPLSDSRFRVQTKKMYGPKAVSAAVHKYGGKYGNLDHVLARWEIDCLQRKFKLCSAVFHSRGKAVIEEYDAEPGGGFPPEEIPPDSYLDLLRRKICP